jgi:Flp pilus assembly protein TadD
MHRLVVSLALLGLLGSTAVAEAAKKDAEAAHKEGMRLARDGHAPDAIEELKRAVSLDPDYPEAWADLGNTYLSQGDLQNAIRALENAVRIRPDFQVARYNLAYSCRKTKDYRRAVLEYRTYLQRDPQDADAEYGLAESLKALGENAAAAEAYDVYARIEKRPGQTKWIQKAKTEADALRQGGALAEAPSPEPVADAAPVGTAGAQKATKKTAPAPAAQRSEAFQAGLQHLKQNDFEGALARLLAAAKNSPDDPMVQAALGSAYLGLRDAAKAEDAYRKALKSATKDATPAIEFGIAESLRLQGDKKAAREEYDRVTKMDETPPSLRKVATDRAAKLR